MCWTQVKTPETRQASFIASEELQRSVSLLNNTSSCKPGGSTTNRTKWLRVEATWTLVSNRAVLVPHTFSLSGYTPYN